MPIFLARPNEHLYLCIVKSFSYSNCLTFKNLHYAKDFYQTSDGIARYGIGN